MDSGEKIRNLLLTGIGVGGLLFCRHYYGPMGDIFHSYGANITFSFGAYFIFKFFRLPPTDKKYMNAAYTLSGVSATEIAQGIGFYRGTYDPLDFFVNAAGIALALGIDIIISRQKRKKEAIS